MRALKAVAGLPQRAFCKNYMEAYGIVVKARAKRSYDAYGHLPVEFPLRVDGHRPVSEDFRRLSDRLLIETLDELGIPYHVVGGSVEERLHRIVQIFNLPVRIPIADAVQMASERVRLTTEAIESDARKKVADRKEITIPADQIRLPLLTTIKI